METQSLRQRINLIVGLGLVALGGFLLLGQILDFNVGKFVWPFFIIIPGLLFFIVMAAGGKATSALAIPGSITTAVGLLLLYQSITGHWESWAYAWALIFPSSIGVGLTIYANRNEVLSLRQLGQGFIRAGLWIFVILGAVFELFLNISGAQVNRLIWPTIIIVFGGFLILQQIGILAFRRAPKQTRDAEPSIQIVPTEEIEANVPAKTTKHN